MESILIALAWLLTTLFVVGVIGCAVTIPIVAFKFLIVPFEKDPEDTEAARVE